jgi:hypothetical protein
MMVYAKSLLAGLCAAAVVMLTAWSLGVGRRVVHDPTASDRVSQLTSSRDPMHLAVVTEDATDVVVPRWYVGVAAGLAFVSAAGWQLRRSRRRRR